MSYPERTIPPTGLSYDRTFWRVMLDSTKRTAVYWRVDASTITLVGYYNTVSAANAARRAAVKTNGEMPVVAVNWWHSTITLYPVGAREHPDARVALPSWIDAEANA
jgi:hypothetical protein